MKPTISNSIKIRYIPRKDTDVHPSTDDYEVSPTKDTLFHDRIRPSQFVSPDNVCLNDKNNTNTYRWSTSKKVLVSTGVILLAATIITVPTVLGILLTQSSDTTSTSSTTTISSTVVSAYWSFDNNTNDFYNVYNGVPMAGASYSIANASNQPFVGHGQALFLLSASSQYVDVSTSFLNLSSRSFTIETWIYSNTPLSGDRGIFGQCQCSTCTNQCLYLITRGTRLHIGFTSNDLTGTTDMSAGIWYHVAFVYNYQTKQQILYINGVQDAIKSNAAAYQGVNGSIRIGASQVYLNTAYFNGFIDNSKVTTRAKSADEMLTAGSLTFYYAFNSSDPTFDNGPNGLPGDMTSVSTVTGRVGEAIRLTGSGSYFRVYGVYNAPFGVANARTFSVSMWINPSTSSSSTFLQIHRNNLNEYFCTNLLGIYSYVGTGGQLFVWSNSNGPSRMTGPFITPNAWTHISLTLTVSAGYTLYVNGNYIGSTGGGNYTTYSNFAYLFLGYYRSCIYASVNFAYQGAIDEFYYHNRELTQADVTALYNV